MQIIYQNEASPDRNREKVIKFQYLAKVGKSYIKI